MKMLENVFHRLKSGMTIGIIPRKFYLKLGEYLVHNKNFITWLWIVKIIVNLVTWLVSIKISGWTRAS